MLYADPALLSLPYYPDESYPWNVVNNMIPELDAKYKAIFKVVYDIWKFLQTIALDGALSENGLYISKESLKAGKSAFKPVFAPLFDAVGVHTAKDRSGVTLRYHSNEILYEMQKLARETFDRARKKYDLLWSINAESLFDFSRCSFNDEWEYIIDRIDRETAMDGRLTALKDLCLERGYRLDMHAEFCQSSTSGFGIDFIRGVGGFHITYNPRKTQLFGFGTKNGVGEKKMLEAFDTLDTDLKIHFKSICRPCSSCLSCTKGGKNKAFTINIAHDGQNFALCPMFPQHEWPAEEFSTELTDRLFRYHELQEYYGR